MQLDKITFEIKDNNNQTLKFDFDPKILNYNIEYLANNHHQPYPLPSNIIDSLLPLRIMKQFVEAHQYSTESIKIKKPLNSSNYAEIVDPITFKLFMKYCLEENAPQATKIIQLAQFIHFHQLSDAVSAAVATNFYIGEQEKALQEFIKRNGLQEISSEEICQIIKLYEDQFRMIEHKAKQELLKISDVQPVQQA